MLTWGQLAAVEPGLTATGRSLYYQVGVGLGFLATTRADGVARVHPVCPLLVDDGLYLFVIPSPKRNDLLRDGRCSLHSFPTDDNEDAFVVSGRAETRDDATLRRRCGAAWMQERKLDAEPPGFDQEQLFEVRIERCLATKTTGYGDYEPQHTIWRAPQPSM
jgi:hypothetical protein